MSRKAVDLSKRLKQASFGLDPELVNPLAVMPMMVDLDKIDPYHRNPRRSVNPKKADIKASILELGGLEQPLPVTRIDGEARYFIYKGGNTRLSCLKELWAETGDTRFSKVRCEFHPYEGTSQALLAHLRENDLRGDISFIDKALVVVA